MIILPKKKKRGRTSKQKEYWTSKQGIAVITKMMRSGLTIQKLADQINVNKLTIYRWANDCPEFSNALHESKQAADAQVENSLYKLATGFDYFEETSTKEGIMKLQKYQAPSLGAIKMWLGNRDPDHWKDTQQLELKGQLDVGRPFKDISDKDLKSLLKKLDDHEAN